MGSPPPGLNQLFEDLAQGGYKFIKRVRKYAASKFANLDVPVSTPSLLPSLLLPSSCPDCSKVFVSYQRMSLHRKVAHGYLDPVK